MEIRKVSVLCKSVLVFIVGLTAVRTYKKMYTTANHVHVHNVCVHVHVCGLQLLFTNLVKYTCTYIVYTCIHVHVENTTHTHNYIHIHVHVHVY